MFKTVPKVFAIVFVKKIFICIEEKEFRTYLTEAVGSLEACYVLEALNYSCITLSIMNMVDFKT